MSYENFDPNDLLIQSYSTKPSGFVQRIPHGIRAIHLPTGTVVTCDADRSQHKNRHDALTQLWELVHGKPTYQDLQAERDALAAQVEALREAWEVVKSNDWDAPLDEAFAAIPQKRLQANSAEIESLKRMIETFSANIPSIQAEAAKAAIYALFEIGNCPQYENGAGDGYIECGDALKFAEKYAKRILSGEVK